MLHNTLAQVALTDTGPRTEALRDIVTELLAMDEPRRRIAGMMSGLDIHYPDIALATSEAGEPNPIPLVGRRMPDLDLVAPGGEERVLPCFTHARPVFLSFAPPGAFDLTAWSDRVRLVEAEVTPHRSPTPGTSPSSERSPPCKPS